MASPQDNGSLMATEGQDWYDELGRTHWYLVGRYALTLDLCRPALPTDEWIVDVGCGPGCLMDGLPEGATTLGVDITRLALKYAKGAGHRRLTQASVLQLPFATGSVGFILAQDVLEHIAGDKQALCEVSRVLKPGGWAFFCVPAFELLRGRHDDLYGHLRRYLVHELRRDVRDAGLRVRKISYVQAMFFLPLLVFRKWKTITACTRCDFQETPGPLNSLLTWLITLERHWLKRWNLPVGCNVVCLAQKPESKTA